MDIKNLIKNILKRIRNQEQVPQLTAGENATVQKGSFKPRNNFMEQYKVNRNIPREPSIEECIEEYIKQYSVQEELKPGSSYMSKSYRAFRRMFCDKKENEGNNKKNQSKLYNKLRKLGYIVDYQTSGSDKEDKLVYMHIMRRARCR